MRSKYERKLERLETRLMREQQELTQDQAEYQARKREELISAGESVISLIGVFGRSRRTTTFSRAARKRRLTAKAKARVTESEREIVRLQGQLEAMRQDMNRDVEDITQEWTANLEDIETYSIKPRRADVHVDMLALGWVPYWEIGYRSVRGKVTHSRVAAWKKKG